MESTGTKESTREENAGGKGSIRKERVKYAGGGNSSGHDQQDFGRESVGQNGKYGELKEVQEEKRYGNVERDTSKTTIVGGEIVRRAKAHKG